MYVLHVSGVRQIVTTRVTEGRLKARVATLLPNRARTVSVVERQDFQRVANEIRLCCQRHPWRSPSGQSVSCNSSLRITATKATLPGFPRLAQVLIEVA